MSEIIKKEGLDIEEYHQSPGISSTGINLILDCPKRYWHEYLNPDKEKKESSAYRLGRAIHLLILEPHLFHEKFYPMSDEINLTTKVGKQIYEQTKIAANGREILRFDESMEVHKIAGSALSHSMWSKIGEGYKEHSFFWNGGIYDTPLRSRPDFYNDKIIIDVKTTESISQFSRSVYSYGYHRQAAMQVDALSKFDGKNRLFSFFVVEKKAPYLAAWLSMDEDSIKKGREDYLEGAALYDECLKYNVWPGYDEKCRVISLPKWISEERI